MLVPVRMDRCMIDASREVENVGVMVHLVVLAWVELSSSSNLGLVEISSMAVRNVSTISIWVDVQNVVIIEVVASFLLLPFPIEDMVYHLVWEVNENADGMFVGVCIDNLELRSRLLGGMQRLQTAKLDLPC